MLCLDLLLITIYYTNNVKYIQTHLTTQPAFLVRCVHSIVLCTVIIQMLMSAPA